MPTRLYPREDVEARLRDLGCTKIKDYSHGSGGLWLNRHGFAFNVPTDIDGRTDQNTLQSVLIDAERTWR